MANSSVPRLCGGILYCLLLEARKPRRKARNKLDGGTDGLTEPDVFAGLIHVVTGEDASGYRGETLKKSATEYKKCLHSSGEYVPFTSPATVSAFDSEIKRKDPDLLKRMSGFIETYLNVSRCEWLVRAVIETIQSDTEVSSSAEFAVDYDCYITKRELHTVRTVALQPFLLSVIHYILLNTENDSGRKTFEAWYSQSSPRAEWKFRRNDLGDTIAPIDIRTDVPENNSSGCVTQKEGVPDPGHEAESAPIDTRSDRQVIAENMTKSLASVLSVLEAHKLPDIDPEKLVKPLGYVAAVAAAQEHQMAEDIRKSEAKRKAAAEKQDNAESDNSPDDAKKAEGTVVHQTIVNQYGDHPVHIDHVENLKL